MSLVEDGTKILHSHVESLFQSGTISRREKQHLEFKIQTLQSEITGYYEHYGGRRSPQPNADSEIITAPPEPNETEDEQNVEAISDMSNEKLSEEVEIMTEHEDNGTLTDNQVQYLSDLRKEILERLSGKGTGSEDEQ